MKTHSQIATEWFEKVDRLVEELAKQYPPDNDFPYPVVQIPVKDLRSALLKASKPQEKTVAPKGYAGAIHACPIEECTDDDCPYPHWPTPKPQQEKYVKGKLDL